MSEYTDALLDASIRAVRNGETVLAHDAEFRARMEHVRQMLHEVEVAMEFTGISADLVAEVLHRLIDRQHLERQVSEVLNRSALQRLTAWSSWHQKGIR